MTGKDAAAQGPAEHITDAPKAAGGRGPAGGPARPALPAELVAAVERLCSTDRLLVAMDFDGVMSPLVPRAQDARPLPGSAAAFASLAGLPRTTTALISGRALASLRAVASPPPVSLLIGSHGAEVWLGPNAEPLVLEPAAVELLDEITRILEEVAADHAGTAVELKPAGAVLHTRQAADSVAASAVAGAHARLDDLAGVYVSEGKRVLEISVVRADKGQGLRTLQAASQATAVLFAGDDVTDEDGFAALGNTDVGVKVGSGQTTAAFRIDSTEDVPALLELVLAGRTAATGVS
ncbi:trehalose-phosphatase [Paenarthrobacter sp. Z7-10]|uniref:trehalose-phosphatase n=1 Tax=Paenarthrobacter sp. Z7-10 TaxID=2787635 RepID=UPI0022A95F85|nr:trehalose-phosphatase [Paenarthrobacter sp. Z7-10]MCZ2404783.1 trehalose-phosphatase [Paenarthrobacter sp. Z7-10]